MSLSREAMMELMAYADGELDAEAHARVEELLRTNDEARSVVEAMGTLGDVVRQGAEGRESGSAQAVDAIADGVMAAIAREPAAEAAKVTPIARAPRPGAGAMTATFVGLALAAGVLLMMRGKSAGPVAIDAPLEPTSPATVVPPAPPADTAAPTAVAEANDSQDNGVDLEEVQSTKNKVNVFFVAPAASAAAGAITSVVVWIDDRPGAH